MSNSAEIFKSVPNFGYVEEAPETNPVEFEKVVRSRRSTRVYTDDEVPEAVMRECLHLALLAPNSSNWQPWEFYWVRSDEQKSELARCCLGQPAAATARELVVCVARLDTWRRNRRLMLEAFETADAEVPDAAWQYYRRIVPLAYGHGPWYCLGWIKKLVFSSLALRKPMPRGPAGKADMRVWAHKSAALACENLMLALRAYGFDSCPMEGMDAVRIRKLLKLPRAAEISMVISAGKRAANGIYGKQIRFDTSLFLFEV